MWCSQRLLWAAYVQLHELTTGYRDLKFSGYLEKKLEMQLYINKSAIYLKRCWVQLRKPTWGCPPPPPPKCGWWLRGMCFQYSVTKKGSSSQTLSKIGIGTLNMFVLTGEGRVNLQLTHSAVLSPTTQSVFKKAAAFSPMIPEDPDKTG